MRLHCFLCDSFKSNLWQSFPQYFTPLHFEHRSMPNFEHPEFEHGGILAWNFAPACFASAWLLLLDMSSGNVFIYPSTIWNSSAFNSWPFCRDCARGFLMQHVLSIWRIGSNSSSLLLGCPGGETYQDWFSFHEMLAKTCGIAHRPVHFPIFRFSEIVCVVSAVPKNIMASECTYVISQHTFMFQTLLRSRRASCSWNSIFWYSIVSFFESWLKIWRRRKKKRGGHLRALHKNTTKKNKEMFFAETSKVAHSLLCELTKVLAVCCSLQYNRPRCCWNFFEFIYHKKILIFGWI